MTDQMSSRAQRGDPPAQIATAPSGPRNDGTGSSSRGPQARGDPPSQIATASSGPRNDVMEVEQFVEKPNAATAAQYLLNGNYYWNAGMFVLKASVWLKALEQFRPDILQATQTAWAKRSADNQFIRPGKAEFMAIPSDSIDYAVMERCPGSAFAIKMVMLNAGWSDLGAWDAVWKVLPKDEHGNAHIGDVLTTESHNTLVHASSRLVSLVGVSDVIVIETADAVLVADKSRSQDVKHIVNALAEEQREEHALHRKVHRPCPCLWARCKTSAH